MGYHKRPLVAPLEVEVSGLPNIYVARSNYVNNATNRGSADDIATSRLSLDIPIEYRIHLHMAILNWEESSSLASFLGIRHVWLGV